MIWCHSLPNLDLISQFLNTDAVSTEAGKSFQKQKAAEHAMAVSHQSPLSDSGCAPWAAPGLEAESLPPDLLHLGANLPYL